MSYIIPDSIIHILHNVPLDTTYANTIYFADKASQASYFSGLSKYTLTDQSYQRVRRGYMRVSYNAELLYDCNYLMFKNKSFGDKWFYAFITSVEYINNEVSEITFELDVLQTWYFDYQLKECFVDREHSSTDEVGDNLVPENIDIGDYVSDDFTSPMYTDALGVTRPILGRKVIAVAGTHSVQDGEIVWTDGGIYSGIFGGLAYTYFDNDNDGADVCARFLTSLSQRVAEEQGGGVVSVFLMPKAFIQDQGELAPTDYEYTIDKKISGLLDGHPVRNKKLYTYPYNFLYCTNLQGSEAIFKYEYFESTNNPDKCEFIIFGDVSPTMSVITAPKHYKGVPLNYDEKMTLSNFPQLSYNTDTFKSWLAQTGLSLAVGAVGTAVTAQGALLANTGSQITNSYMAREIGRLQATGGKSDITRYSNQAHYLSQQSALLDAQRAQIGTNAIADIGGMVGNSLWTGISKAIAPMQAHTASSPSTLASAQLLDFAFMHKHIRKEYAEIIDKYFDLYGYATKRVKVPNTHVRSEYTYTKTIGCTIIGSIPADDARAICNIFDNGIRFWTNGNHIGEYFRNNFIL